MRERLRALPTFPAGFADGRVQLDPATAPATPVDLFSRWLDEAVEVGAPGAQAAVLSTADGDGVVTARTLTVKDVVGDDWWFASSSAGPKGRALEQNPHAALTFFWPALGRQVRVTGCVRRAPAQAGARDFAARPPQSRAGSLAGPQSEPLDSTETLQRAYDDALARAEADPSVLDESWSAYALTADEVEFWESVPGRGATRWVYRRRADGWVTGLLWP
ncbi:pyridoxamine 5'-phosphate oxidase [Cellulomonas composti]|uniref:Pyridoxamine 5'-phosphate oxidase n=2 Tax=Cellulomonas composti TaxID=266130 RepID=A0A511J8A4_9CELL|nr:pyridoxamine 5'-phosphate oxidase [Cellulomonas composti]